MYSSSSSRVSEANFQYFVVIRKSREGTHKKKQFNSLILQDSVTVLPYYQKYTNTSI